MLKIKIQNSNNKENRLKPPNYSRLIDPKYCKNKNNEGIMDKEEKNH